MIRITGVTRPSAVEAAHEIEAGKTRHAHVGDHAIEAVVVAGNESIGAGKAGDRDALALEIELEGIEHRRIVVDQRHMHRITRSLPPAG